MVGPGRLELPTPRLSSVCSNQLSYGPIEVLAADDLAVGVPKPQASQAQAAVGHLSGQSPIQSLDRKRNVNGGACITSVTEVKGLSSVDRSD